MFNSVLHQHDRITTLQTLLNEIKSKGTISMESADLIERLVPGEIGQHDSDIMFDLDESEEGVPIAMEAGLAGLSKLKIAFIVAIIAFIGRYVLSLNKNSYSFSASGGGGGGWGGSAPPTFNTNKAPTDPACHAAVDDYMELIDQDIKKLRDQYRSTLDSFLPSVVDNNVISGMKNNAKVQFLVNTLLPRILNNNGGGQSVKRGFNLFETKASNPMNLDSKNWAPFLNVSDKTKVTDEQLKKLPLVLKILDTHYSPEKVFTRYYKDGGELETGFVTGIGLPYFVLDPELRTRTLSYIQIINSLVSNVDGFRNTLDDFIKVVNNPIQSGPDLNEGLQYSGPLWKWLSENLTKEGTSSTIIKKFITEVTPLIDEAKDLESSDTVYLNTMTRSRALKQFVKYTIDGSGSGGDEKVKKVVASSVASKGMGELLSSHNKEGLGKLLDGVLEPLNKVNDELSDNASSITSFTKTCEELERVIESAIEKLRANHQGDKNYSQMGKEEKVKLDEADDTNVKDLTEARKNLPHMFNLTSALIQMLLMTVAAGAKYNTELSKLVKTRCDLVVGKSQEIAHDYAQLISTMNAISKSV
jgi:hypothetical protein